jgi:hypothetical protein
VRLAAIHEIDTEPMPPTPPNATGRFLLKYSTGNAEHTMMMRVDEGTSAAIAAQYYEEFIGAHDPILRQISIVSFSYIAIGQDFQQFLVWPLAATYGSGQQPLNKEPLFIAYSGRSPTGKQVRVTLFGVDFNLPTDFRFTEAESPIVAVALSQLRLSAAYWQTNDSSTAVWKSYANCGMNAYWQRALRS